jgi:hypothetical protein
MVIRLLKPWQGWKRGHVFAAFSEGAANTLIKRGIAVADTDPKADQVSRSIVRAGDARRGKVAPANR